MINIKNSEQLANNIRKHAVTMTSLGGSAHIGSILSIADILAVLYGSILKYNSKDPKWIDRDRFILSNGVCNYTIIFNRKFLPIGGFPIKIETQISKLITYSLAIFII